MLLLYILLYECQVLFSNLSKIFFVPHFLPLLTAATMALDHPSTQLIDAPKPSPTSAQGNGQRSELAGAIQ
jgi:hypothetical protein